jgi:hypothetical protein
MNVKRKGDYVQTNETISFEPTRVHESKPVPMQSGLPYRCAAVKEPKSEVVGMAEIAGNQGETADKSVGNEREFPGIPIPPYPQNLRLFCASFKSLNSQLFCAEGLAPISHTALNNPPPSRFDGGPGKVLRSQTGSERFAIFPRGRRRGRHQRPPGCGRRGRRRGRFGGWRG